MPDQPSSKRWRILAFVVVAALLVAAVLSFRRLRGSEFRWDRFASTFSQLDPVWLAAAVILILFTYVGRALRWQVLLRPVSPNSNLWRIFVATAIGFTALVILGRPGELVRPYL